MVGEKPRTCHAVYEVKLQADILVYVLFTCKSNATAGHPPDNLAKIDAFKDNGG